MTQEEKARAYNKVREKIAIRFGSNVAEEIFSEFEESEDEKIRKDILQFIRNWLEGYNPKYTTDKKECNAMIAWLEKQGEQKSIQTPHWMINFLDGYRRNIGCALSYDECKEVDGKILSIIEWLKGNHNIEQNPVEWNEEDDRMLQTLVLGIGNYTYFSGIQSEDAVNWLKSLKQKFKEE